MAANEHNDDDNDDDGGNDVRVLTMVPTMMIKSETATATSTAMMPPLPLPLPLPPPLPTMATRGRRMEDDKCDVDNPVDINDNNLTTMMGL